MICKAALSSAAHPEYGSVTVSFPLSDSEYDHTIERLENLEIGDVLKQDCRIMKLESQNPVLKRIEGTEVNVDDAVTKVWTFGKKCGICYSCPIKERK